jgi:hypothetical protein
MANTWHNDDGLFVRFGRKEGETQVAGEYRGVGQLHEVQVLVDFARLNDVAAGTEQILSDTVRIPATAHLKAAEFYVETAFVGASGTLSFGLIDEDRATAFDADGIDATIAVTAIDAIGDTITCDGALINTTLTNTTPLLITATNATTAFTAGKGYLTLQYYTPHTYTP